MFQPIFFEALEASSAGNTQQHGVQRRMVLVVNFFRIFEIIIFFLVVAICDLVHDVEAMYGLC